MRAMGIDLLGDVLTDPSLRPDDVDTERQVILEEIAMDDDSPDDVAQQRFAEQLYLDHPLGRDTAGVADTVETITAAEVRAFFERALHRRLDGHLGGRSAATTTSCSAMIDTSFSRVRSGDGRIARSAPSGTGTAVTIEDDTEQVHLVIGGRGLDRTDPDREALDVVNHVLGGGLSSRLFEEIREKRGLVYSVYSGLACYSDTGSWSISTSTQPRHADEVVELVMAELHKLVADGITDDELDIARGYLTGVVRARSRGHGQPHGPQRRAPVHARRDHAGGRAGAAMDGRRPGRRAPGDRPRVRRRSHRRHRRPRLTSSPGDTPPGRSRGG